jgi:spore maturation protein CgeB
MKALYIGQYTNGTTSRMRCKVIQQILKPKVFEVIDTHVPFYKTSSLLRSFGFRYKKGPLIKNINQYIVKSIRNNNYDLIWVDKAVFITSKTTQLLKSKTSNLVHFTPDPAFTFHQSKHFHGSLSLYDYVITTKSYELEDYYKRCSKSKVLYATQGFDKKLHKPSEFPFSKKEGFVFIGHHEVEREKIIELLLHQKIKVTLAGIKWESFAKRCDNNPNLNYLGKGLFGEDYVKTIQEAKIAWGAISKWVPELHTTRTFEIPACGTALLTEHNEETASFFEADEVLFYKSHEELIKQVKDYMDNEEALKSITLKGYEAVNNKGYDYVSILTQLLKTVLN